jgi:hypothetical protein
MLGNWICTESYCFNVNEIIQVEDKGDDFLGVEITYKTESSMGEVARPHTEYISGEDGRQFLAALRMMSQDATKFESVDEF